MVAYVYSDCRIKSVLYGLTDVYGLRKLGNFGIMKLKAKTGI